MSMGDNIVIQPPGRIERNLQKCWGQCAMPFYELRRNLIRIFSRDDEKKTRTLLVFGVLTNLNGVITSILNLAGFHVAALISGLVIGCFTIVTFMIQSGLFDPVGPL